MTAGDLVLGDDRVTVTGTYLNCQTTDLWLDAAERRQSPAGVRRALCHGIGDKLVINCLGDYPNGVEIQSNVWVRGTLSVEAQSLILLRLDPSRDADPNNPSDYRPYLNVGAELSDISNCVQALQNRDQSFSVAVFSPDGKCIATATSPNFQVWLWDAVTGSQKQALAGHSARVASAAFSPDSTRLVTASDDGTARVWNVATGAILHVLNDGSPLRSAVFSPDGTRIVTTDSAPTIRLWNADSGALITALGGHS